MQRINPQQGRPSTNGYSRRRVDPMLGSRTERAQSRKSVSPNFGSANGVKAGRITSPSRDRLIYVLSCLVGRHVEVHVKNGSIISGIFHATNADRDFEIVLEMAQVVKDGSVREQKSAHDIVTMPQLMIIPARELVQVLAKDFSLDDELTSGHTSEKKKDLMIDSVISHSHHADIERELSPWIPDEDDPQCPELENTFNRTLDRNWDQFETNETLFGVKSTFNEEIYTTKLEKGPQMKDIERVASRIAREIEGEDTRDFHQAEERGFYFDGDTGLDEETRYSAVCREGNDSRFRENKNSHIEAYNSDNFAGPLGSVTSRSYSDSSSEKIGNKVKASHNETLTLSTSSSVDDETNLHSGKDLGLASVDQKSQLTSDFIEPSSSSLDAETRLNENKTKNEGGKSEFKAFQDSQVSDDKQLSAELEVLSTSAAFCDPPSASQGNRTTESTDSQALGNLPAANESVGPSIRQGGSTEHSCSDPALNHPRLSPSSSCGSLSSEKSTLNPNAKEFKLNPNAKSFTPSSGKQHAAVSDGSYYYPSNVASVPHMPGVPVGVGVGPSFSHQPVFYNPQAAPMQTSQTYIHPGGPLYGQQQMLVGQPPQFYYVPGYPPEMPHRGRKY
ncbi:polyadenylate-binding protein-interacting protein 4-like [Canna indica]|uniref:Polyadenylate-binding protein-interacting protein 4-like n=1 Tax=Canna indica TaxID=4628 RepID=A0AAQ3QK26_9LILI|nr:polyadenylate-binding protein-interacting protein 4-like [Canna indica]